MVDDIIVAVIGAGLSGLCAAHELRKAGVDVIVLSSGRALAAA